MDLKQEIRRVKRHIWIIRAFLVFETLATSAMLGATVYYAANSRWGLMVLYAVCCVIWGAGARRSLDLLPQYGALLKAMEMTQVLDEATKNLLDK